MNDLVFYAWLALIVGALALAGSLHARAVLGGRRRRRLRPFRSWRRFLEATRGARPAIYMGRLRSGRRARVVFDGVRVRLAVSADRGLPGLRIRLEDAFDRLKRGLSGQAALGEVVVGDGAFDDAFLLETTDHEGARRLLKEDLRRAIDLAFAQLRLERLILEHGELAAEAAVAALAPARWEQALVTLDRAATLVETKPLRVRCLGEERLVVCDGGGGARCAYCRDQVTGDEDGLVACDRCRTVVHDACWGEHGGCPVLGCAGGQAERARAR